MLLLRTVNLGASFNATLVEAIGKAIGMEARAHENFWNSQGFRGPGLHCLSPNANIARSPLCKSRPFLLPLQPLRQRLLSAGRARPQATCLLLAGMQGAILHRRVATCRSILLLLSGGRTQEVYGEDPTHAAEMVGRYVRGMQQRGRAPAGAAQPELLLAGSVTKHWMVRARSSEVVYVL